MSDPTSEYRIINFCSELSKFLTEKNRRYGDSALAPERVFSRVGPDAGICIRLDDKLSRIRNSGELRKNDVVDLLGYLVLLALAQGWDRDGLADLID